MRIFIKEKGLKVINPDDNHASFHRWEDLSKGEDLVIDREPEPDIVEWSESESFFSDNGIDLSKSDPYQQHLVWKEAKQQEEADRIAQEQAEQKAFRESPEGQELLRQYKIEQRLSHVEIMAKAAILNELIEERESEYDMEEIRVEIESDIRDEKVENVGQAIREKIKAKGKSKDLKKPG